METIRAGNLDESARRRVVIFKKARAQNIFADGEAASARDNPATEQTSYLSDAAYSRSRLTAENEPCGRCEVVAGAFPGRVTFRESLSRFVRSV
jgi:hypothetical protein